MDKAWKHGLVAQRTSANTRIIFEMEKACLQRKMVNLKQVFGRTMYFLINESKKEGREVW